MSCLIWDMAPDFWNRDSAFQLNCFSIWWGYLSSKKLLNQQKIFFTVAQLFITRLRKPLYSWVFQSKVLWSRIHSLGSRDIYCNGPPKHFWVFQITSLFSPHSNFLNYFFIHTFALIKFIFFNSCTFSKCCCIVLNLLQPFKGCCTVAITKKQCEWNTLFVL